MFQQEAESEGVQPNHNNNMPNSISEEPINRLPSNLGGSAHQSPLFYIPNSSSEEPIHQLPSNLGRSDLSDIEDDDDDAYDDDDDDEDEEEAASVSRSSQLNSSSKQPQLSQPQSAGVSALQPRRKKVRIATKKILGRGVQPNADPGPRESYHETEIDPNAETEIDPAQSRLPKQFEGQFKIWTAERLNRYRPLCIAAQRGDWKAAICFKNNIDPDALTAKITAFTGKTVLHVAACCWQWEFVLNLLELTSRESIAVKTRSGKTVLHYVAQGGSLKTVKALVQKNSNLLQIKDNLDCLPLFHSISSGNKELVWYLSLKTTDESSSDPSFPRILRHLIISGYHDIVLYFIRRYPDLKLAIAKDKHKESLLHWLATNPSGFFSGSNLGFLERWIYKFIHVEKRNLQIHLNMEDIPEPEGFPTLQPSFATQVFQWFKRFLWKTIAQPVAYVEKVRDVKLKHECAVELVKHVCTQLSNMSFQEMKDFLLKPKDIMASAVKGGIEEIVRALFQQFPDLTDVQLMTQDPQRNILQVAIQFRQVEIVNIFKKIFPTKTKSMSSYTMESENTTLHLAGELAPQIKLLSVPGAALQMQRELQWFKEVEEIVFPEEREKKNMNKETPKEVFRRAHKELANEGEKWMKDTANSCMLVSTLIATVLFAAAFTVPGGNINDNGIPIFLRTNAFTIFAISDALGLFFSLTSLLMFLAILTARYDIEDFLKSLPNKLIIGLGSLFFAIAAMITAFGAALTIILSERWHWVFMPITLVASLPVVMFVLFVQMFWSTFKSTFGASIFRPWPSRV